MLKHFLSPSVVYKTARIQYEVVTCDNMKNMKICAAAIMLCLGLSSLAQTGITVEEQSALQDVLDTYFSENNYPGLSAAVYFDEEGLFQGSAGISHEDVQMDTSMFLGIASNTKLFTAVICLKMIEQGYFTLDDQIGDWLQDFENVDPSITVRQLLRHESGLSDYINNLDLIPGEISEEPHRVWKPEEIVAEIGTPWGQPGEFVAYSNINFILAAMILEAATQKKYIDLVKDSLLNPLGLDDVFLEGFDTIQGEQAHPFLFGVDYANIPRTALGSITWSAGCMVSRPATVSSWYNALFNSEFLSEEVRINLKDFVDWPDNMDGDRMGMGMYDITHNGRKYYGHGGRTIGYSSFALYDIECGNSIFVVNNEIFSEARSLAFELAEKACELENMETSTENTVAARADISLFPNPASEEFIVSVLGKDEMLDQISIIDAQGRVLYNSSGLRSTKFIYNTASMPQGVYFIRIKTDHNVILKKLFVQNE